jgi:DNA mismatch repair protein MutL
MSMSQPRVPIRPLSETLVNQIAAGEVVERPASVVKELLENCLDAGAGEVVVEIEAGGLGLIRVRDDGAGIPVEELALALRRHATSKISRPADLAAIASLGFRGEALASIGAVARLALTSHPRGGGHGARVTLEGTAEPRPPVPAGHPPGTTVEVRDLFFNVPARRRFLKGEKTEFFHIQQTVRRFAHACPAVAVTLLHNGARILKLPAARGDGLDERRWQGLFGSEFLAHSVAVAVTAEGIALVGRVGLPACARSTSDHELLAVNARTVRDRTLAHALHMAYAGLLPEGRQPAYGLHLTLDPQAVDVNVHPTKAEVRFRDPRTVHDLLYATVARALAPPLLPPLLPPLPVAASVAAEGTPPEAALGGRPLAPFPPNPSSGADLFSGQSFGSPYGGPSHRRVAEEVRPYDPRLHAPAAAPPAIPTAIPTAIPAAAAPEPATVVRLDPAHWLLVEEGAVVLLHRPRAARVLALAALRRDAVSGRLPRRPVLLPTQYPASPREVSRVEAGAAWLLALGLVVEPLGPQLLVVRECPAVLEDGALPALLPRLLAVLPAHPEGTPDWAACLPLLAGAVTDLPPTLRDPRRLPALAAELLALPDGQGEAACRRLSLAELDAWLDRPARQGTGQAPGPGAPHGAP